jgi:ligand-binding sensor domain-containing protein/anti-sigma regulatory factor (Ser/Thr protein kinase)
MRKTIFCRWWCLVVGLLWGIQAIGQVKDYNFRQLSLEEGLSQSSVFAIAQDDDGFMWFGTQDGLNKYDGYGFHVYKKRPFDSTSLSHSHIRSLLKDKSGNLWIGTTFGLNLLDKRTHRFINLSYLLGSKTTADRMMINCLYEDSRGIIWVGTSHGLVRLVPPSEKGNSYKKYQSFPSLYEEKDLNSLSNNSVHSFLEDKQGHIWVGTLEGINRVEKAVSNTREKLSFKNYRNSALSIFHLEGKFISSIVQDTYGHFWLGTGRGLYRTTASATQPPEYYAQQPGKDEAQKSSPSQNHFLTSNQVYSLLLDSKGTLWVGTLGGGINKVHLDEVGNVSAIVSVLKNNTQEKGIRNDFVLSMYESKEKQDGTLWFGLEAGGIAQFNPFKNNFKLYRHESTSDNTLSDNNIFAVLRDHEDMLWIGTSKGLNRYNPQTRQYTQFYHQPDDIHSLAENHVFSLYEDQEGVLWVGTGRGLDRYNRQTNQFEAVKVNFDSKNETAEPIRGSITTLHEDTQHQLWIGASSDLIRLDKKTMIGKSYGYHAKNGSRLTGGKITTVYEDRQGILWIGTYAGLNRYDRQKDDFIHYANNPTNHNTLSSNTVLSMLQDNSGTYWIATELGLNKMTLAGEKATFSHYMEKDGMPNNFVYGVLADEVGRIWMSTNLGISVFDPRKNNFVNYDEADGLQSKEFNSGAYYRGINGEMFFGGINGLNSFFPDNMPVNRHVPKVKIVSLYKFEQPIDLDSLRAYTEEVILDYNENFFSFEFVSLDFANPQKNRYAYQLEGFNKNWIYCGNRRYVSFTNLDPGEYTFKVKGSNDSNIWNNEAFASIRIVVRPPFWQTWWFYFLSLAIVLMSIKVIHDVRVRQKLNYLLDLEKIRKMESERVQRQTASDFHDEMGNRITRIGVLTELIKVKLSNPMLISDYAGILPTEDLVNGIPASGEIGSLLSKISENCNSLYNGTRDFIWSINPDNHSFYEVAMRLKDFGDDLFDNPAIHFQTNDISESFKAVKLPMDWSRQLILIFKEALTNALKHADCQQAHLEFRMQGEEIFLILSDDGQGFTTGMKKGGTGLTNMANRANKINSFLEVTSEKKQGTKIVFHGKLPQNGGLL